MPITMWKFTGFIGHWGYYKLKYSMVLIITHGTVKISDRQTDNTECWVLSDSPVICCWVGLVLVRPHCSTVYTYACTHTMMNKAIQRDKLNWLVPVHLRGYAQEWSSQYCFEHPKKETTQIALISEAGRQQALLSQWMTHNTQNENMATEVAHHNAEWKNQVVKWVTLMDAVVKISKTNKHNLLRSEEIAHLWGRGD